ncbi:hypothetical protein T492DRAFT_841596 [Pavlovales sp. CCMP2436]|nr:hypothetical protein T492DRAFT_841596 [Pavlovales sp. CCMP2436]
MATRSMQQAEYFRAGALSLEEFWHYGLAAEIYTHFTSPIRRYSDQLVHRMLAAAIGIEPLSQMLMHPSPPSSMYDTTSPSLPSPDPAPLQEMLRPERLEALVDNMNRSISTFFGGAVGIKGLILGLIDENNPGAYVYDEEKCTLRTPFSLLRVFQKKGRVITALPSENKRNTLHSVYVTVEIVVDASKPHRPRLVIDIVQPQCCRKSAAFQRYVSIAHWGPQRQLGGVP